MEALAALIPSIGVGILFYVLMKAMIGADRNERAAMAKLDRQEAEAQAAARRSSPESDLQPSPDSGDAENADAPAHSPGRSPDPSA